MKIKRLISQTFEANCYVVINENQAIIIDPCVSVAEIAATLGSAEVIAIFLTHAHFDHILHLEEVSNYYQVKIYLHHNAIEKLADSRKNYSAILKDKISLVFDGQLLEEVDHLDNINIFNDIPIIVYHTPGHTNCSLCYLIGDHLFTGDTLFKANIGRSDLYTGDFNTLKKSLSFLKTLPDDVRIYPGHGNETTIKQEKLNNHYFK